MDCLNVVLRGGAGVLFIYPVPPPMRNSSVIDRDVGRDDILGSRFRVSFIGLSASHAVRRVSGES